MGQSLPGEILTLIIEEALRSSKSDGREAFLTNARSLTAANKTAASIIHENVHPMACQIVLYEALVIINNTTDAIIRALSPGNNDPTGAQDYAEVTVDADNDADDKERDERFCGVVRELTWTLGDVLGPSEVREPRPRKMRAALREIMEDAELNWRSRQ